MRLVPSIDLDGPRAVKRVRGRRGTGLDLGDPRRLVDRIASYGFRKIHVVDLRGAEEGRITGWSLELAGYARSLGLEVRLGGGIRSLEDALRAREAGASEIMLGTLWVKNPGLAGAIAGRLGRVWAAVDEGASGTVMVRGWTASGGLSVGEALERIEHLGFEGVLYTFIPVEGTLQGVPVDKLRRVRLLTGLRLAYAGGIAGPRDLEALRDLGVDEAVVGMALYTGSIPWEVAAGYA
ncbi:MAG: hypothetical protein GSR78_01100 [Desulfurococcales archaeon]|nr:hypothetical protein [Desulfurococcales archaeon]